MEIDDRAGALAAFALAMKARAKRRRFFRMGVEPNICVLQNVSFTAAEMQDVRPGWGGPVHRSCARRCDSSSRPRTSAR